jgi:hypothetical protein
VSFYRHITVNWWLKYVNLLGQTNLYWGELIDLILFFLFDSINDFFYNFYYYGIFSLLFDFENGGFIYLKIYCYFTHCLSVTTAEKMCLLRHRYCFHPIFNHLLSRCLFNLSELLLGKVMTLLQFNLAFLKE